MTFAAKVSTLKRVEPILRKHTTGSYPHDFDMFLELRAQNELLVSSIPAYSTHGETKWLAPLVDWSTVSAVTSPQKYFPYINKDVEE